MCLEIGELPLPQGKSFLTKKKSLVHRIESRSGKEREKKS
jgi:hypothetical protein